MATICSAPCFFRAMSSSFCTSFSNISPGTKFAGHVTWENGYCESFNGKLRDECLKGEIFYSLKEAQVVIEQWRVHYNTVRPHSSLGYRPPAPQATLLKETGHGDMENAARFPHLHTPDDDYELLSKKALH